jgi:hypothetical protein
MTPEVRVVRPAPVDVAPTEASAPLAQRPKLLEASDPQTRVEVLAVVDRIIAKAHGWVPESIEATLHRIRDRASLALPATDGPLDLTDHDTWQVRQICIDYLPRALDHYIALPSDLATEPLLDGRSARQVLDDQLALIDRRLDEVATRSYRREAAGLLSHARFVADSLGPDPFQDWLANIAVNQPEPVPVTRKPAPAEDASVTTRTAAAQEREQA